MWCPPQKKIIICFSWHAVTVCSHLFLVFENRTLSLTLWKSERTLESVSAGVWPQFISCTLPPLASSLASIFKAEAIKTWLYRNLPVCTVLEESSYIISNFFLQINAQNSHFCGVFVLNPCSSCSSIAKAIMLAVAIPKELVSWQNFRKKCVKQMSVVKEKLTKSSSATY